MPKPSFNLSVSVSISNPQIEAEIQTAFENTYRNERGDDESLADFVERKLEEQMLSIYASQHSNATAAAAVREVTKDITAAATIKKRKDKVEAAKPRTPGDAGQ